MPDIANGNAIFRVLNGSRGHHCRKSRIFNAKNANETNCAKILSEFASFAFSRNSRSKKACLSGNFLL
jgi:hypothetical protein